MSGLEDALFTGASEKGTRARLFPPPVEGKLIRGCEGLDVGDRVRVQLIGTDLERGFIDFARAGWVRRTPQHAFCQGVLLGCFPSFSFAFCSCLFIFCFRPLSLSFLPLSPIACLLFPLFLIFSPRFSGCVSIMLGVG